MLINIRSVLGVLVFVTSLKNPFPSAQALVDVSTAYCNCNLDHIEERIYPSPGDSERMVDLCKVFLLTRSPYLLSEIIFTPHLPLLHNSPQWLEPAILDSKEVTKKLIGDRPNTYTFTKVANAAAT